MKAERKAKQEEKKRLKEEQEWKDLQALSTLLIAGGVLLYAFIEAFGRSIKPIEKKEDDNTGTTNQ
jgi:hypothetical protein